MPLTRAQARGFLFTRLAETGFPEAAASLPEATNHDIRWFDDYFEEATGREPLDSFLTRSFGWGSTPQGHNYWGAIRDQLRSRNQEAERALEEARRAAAEAARPPEAAEGHVSIRERDGELLRLDNYDHSLGRPMRLELERVAALFGIEPSVLERMVGHRWRVRFDRIAEDEDEASDTEAA